MNLAHAILHLTVPRKSNNHRARLLHHPVLAVLCLAIIGLQFGLNYLPQLNPQILGYAANISPQVVIELTNQKRAEAGLPALRYNPSLEAAAKAKGEHMLANDYWAHNAPDGTEPWKFFADVGYKYRYAGENLARDFSNPSSAVDAWMASPTHRDNLLSPKYSEIGIAVVEGDLAGADTTLIVQLFGTQLGDTLPTTPVAAVQDETNQTLAKTTISPTAEPTIAPTAAPESKEETQAVESPAPSQVLISPFTVTKGVSLGLIGLLLGVIVVDGIVISRKKIGRKSGRSFAHFAFLGMILAIVLIAKAGKIL